MLIRAVTVVLFVLHCNGLAGASSSYNKLQFIELGSNGAYVNTVGTFSGNRGELTGVLYPPVNMGDRAFEKCRIYTNGVLSFSDQLLYSSYPENFVSAFSTDYVIAPFWTRKYPSLTTGQIRYEIHNDYSTGDNLKKSISTFLSRSVGHTVTVQSVLIAEWKDMVQYHSIDDKLTNTFQAIIASDDYSSYAIFTYQCGGMQWSSSNATIGFKITNGLYRSHPYSRVSNFPNPIACLNSPDSQWSNVVYRLGRPKPYKCSSNEFGCGDGSCIFSDNICNRFSDCNDGTDELNCHQWSVPSCRSIQYKCLSGGCVSTSKLCDGTDDCADGSDELNCSNVSTGTVTGIAVASLVIIILFGAVIMIVIYNQIKQHRQRRAQFERLRSEVSVRTPPPPATQTLYFHPKPGEWYQTVEGNWVQGPPPSYFADSNNTSTGAEIMMQGQSASPCTAQIQPIPSSDVQPPTTSDPVNLSSEPSASNEVGVVSDEGNPLESSSSGSSVIDQDDTPLIAS